MKTIFFIPLLLISGFLKSQILIDSIIETGPYSLMHAFPGTEGEPDNIYVNHMDDDSRKFMLLKFDENLQLTDTFAGADVGRPSSGFAFPFNFNNGLYYFCPDSLGATTRNFSIHKLENGVFTDSLDFDLDTIPDAYPFLTKAIDNNTLEVLLILRPPPQSCPYGIPYSLS